MTSAAAISATFVDYRRIKGRKVHQIIFEVPSENWPEAYKALGEPTIDTAEWFAIAKMTGAKPQDAKGGKLAQRAGILCAERGFMRFAQEAGYDDPVKMIYSRCDVTSRRHLDHDDQAARAFHDIEVEYKNWLNGAVAA